MSFLKPDQTSPTSGLESDSTLKSNTYKNSGVSEHIVVLTPDQTNRTYELQPWCQWVHVQLHVIIQKQ